MEQKKFTATPWITPLNGCFCVEFCRFGFDESLSLVLYIQCRRTKNEWETYSISSQNIYSYRCLRNLLFYQKKPEMENFPEPVRLHKWTSTLSGSDWESCIDYETLATSNIVHYRIETDTHIFDFMSAEEPKIRKLPTAEVQKISLSKQEKLDVYHSPEEAEEIIRFHEQLKKKP